MSEAPIRPEVVLFDQYLNLGVSLEWLHQINAENIQGINEVDDTEPVEAGTPLIQTYTLAELGLLHSTTAQVEAHVNKAIAHYELLQQFGMCVVSHAIETRASLKPESRLGKNTIAAYTTTTFVPNSVPLNSVEADTQLHPDRINNLVVGPLLDYIDWCRRNSSPPELLGDIYKASQYSWQMSTGIIFLHDVAPLLMNDLDREPDAIEESVQHLQDSAALIPYNL